MATTRNQRLTTRDIVVVAASAVVLVASFLPLFSVEGFSSGNAWSRGALVYLVLGFFAAIAVGVLVALDTFAGVGSPAGRVGLSAHQLAAVLATVSLLTFVLALLAIEGVSVGLGLILGLLGSIVLFVVVVFGDRIPALAAR
jgi:hypothetical protein